MRITNFANEMRDAFGWDVDRYVYFGGYPGAAALIEDRQRWSRYIVESLIETTLSRGTVFLTRVGRVGEVIRRPGLHHRPEEVIV